MFQYNNSQSREYNRKKGSLFVFLSILLLSLLFSFPAQAADSAVLHLVITPSYDTVGWETDTTYFVAWRKVSDSTWRSRDVGADLNPKFEVVPGHYEFIVSACSRINGCSLFSDPVPIFVPLEYDHNKSGCVTLTDYLEITSGLNEQFNQCAE